MGIKTIKLVLIILSLTFGVVSCGKIIPYRNETQISSFNEDESHYFGENCMDCHYSAGKGEGWFNLAGSVSGNSKNATVELYKNMGEAAIKIIEVDVLGNFYTTEDINFEGGLFVGIRNALGEIEFMDSTIQLGQCNLCHGATTDGLSMD